VLTRLYEARFRRMVRPGELVRTRVELAERVGPAFVFAARSQVDGARAAEVRLALAAAGALARSTGGAT
jgi:3-hydroxymyristoyl/3-hydroxydecanoyl-(acyl carrier protein) dehydratase